MKTEEVNMELWKRMLKGILSCRRIFVVLVLLFSFSPAQEDASGKIVYLDLDFEGKELEDMPFFTGLIIEERREEPGIKFYFEKREPPQTEISLRPSLRGLITRIERENTFDEENAFGQK
ncbi:hypothetical protein ACFL5V_02740 [Fibrobacterota bacterium]